MCSHVAGSGSTRETQVSVPQAPLSDSLPTPVLKGGAVITSCDSFLSSLELAAPSLKGLTVTRAAGVLAYLCLGSRVATFFKTENTTHFYLCIFNENCVTDDSFRLATLSEVLAMLTSGGWMMWEHCTCWGTNSRT